MRTRIYIDGKPSWSENEPGYAVLYRGSIRGELVTSHTPSRPTKLTANQTKDKA